MERIARFTLPTSAWQIRTLSRLAVALRWIAIALGGVAGQLAPPSQPRVLVGELMAAAVFNGAITMTGNRVSDENLRTVALLTTIVDLALSVTFIEIYMPTAGSQLPLVYVLPMIEATAFFGVAGACLAVAVYLLGTGGQQAVAMALWHQAPDWTGALQTAVLIFMVAICLAGANQILTLGGRAGEPWKPGQPIRLSRREQEVLRLVARGYSNSMIAAELGISEYSVKNSIERMLSQMRARNRAEAVATAARLHLF
jgi:DNA-binding CsgD family transcriptional regulator